MLRPSRLFRHSLRVRSSFWADVWVLSHFLHASRMERRRSGWWTIGGNGVIFGTRWHTTVQDWPAWPILNNAWQRNAHLYCLQQRPISILKLPSLLSPVKLFIQQRLTDSRAAPSTFAEADERHRQWLSLVFVGHVFLDSLSPCGLHWPAFKNRLLSLGRTPHSSWVCASEITDHTGSTTTWRVIIPPWTLTCSTLSNWS